MAAGAVERPGRGSGGLVRGLDATAAASIIVGIVIGSGIFRTPNTVADIVGATGLIFIVYILAGILVLIGALCYAELGAMLPRSGGAYVYVREAYGPMPAFLLGWTSFAVTQIGSLAAVAVFFGELGAVLFELSSPWAVDALAIGAIVALAITNTLGVRLAGLVQVGFTGFKIAALSSVIVVGLWFGRGDVLALTPVFPETWDFDTVGLIGLAMVSALFAYDGWTNANNVAEEIEDPARNLPRALALGVLFIIAIYLAANLAYVWALGLDGMAASNERAAANVFENAFGECINVGDRCIPPGSLITLVIFVSLIGSLNGQTIAYPRIFYAMARNGLFFKIAARTHPRFHTPHYAIMAQTVWAAVLVISGTFEDLIEYVVFASYLFYALAAGAVMVLRRKLPDVHRPYKVPFYPVLPIIFIVAATLFTVNLFIQSPRNSLIGAAFVLIGIPVYYVWRHYGGGKVEEDPDVSVVEQP